MYMQPKFKADVERNCYDSSICKSGILHLLGGGLASVKIARNVAFMYIFLPGELIGLLQQEGGKYLCELRILYIYISGTQITSENIAYSYLFNRYHSKKGIGEKYLEVMRAN